MQDYDVKRIRSYWSSYYSNSEKMESLHVRLDRIQTKVNRLEAQKRDYPHGCLFEFLEDNMDFFRTLLEDYMSCKNDINELQELMDQNEKDFYNLLLELKLEKEERTYEEDLYNLVNGLEDNY